MHAYVVDMLQCPACHGALSWSFGRRAGDRIEEAEAVCRSCGAAYPVREGIGVFLTPDLPRNDLWEIGENRLQTALEDDPALEQALMGVPAESLNPTDQFYRAGVLRSRGQFAEARELGRIAWNGIYTPEYLTAHRQRLDHALEQLGAHRGPIVDLASGRGILADEILERLDNPLLMTDFSPRILREDRRRLMALGLYDRVSLLSFDARRTPFRDGAVAQLTTFEGLTNIEHPGDLLRELRRVVSGSFLALASFFSEADKANGDLIRQFGLEQMLFRRPALQNFAEAGWELDVAQALPVRMAPTPQSVLFPGSTVDGLPVAETEAEFCVLRAH